METSKYFFEVDLSLGSNCVGQCCDDTLECVVELTADEAEALRGWLEEQGDPDFLELEEQLPDISDTIRAAVNDALWWWAAEDGITNNGYEDLGDVLFEQEVRDGVYALEGVDLDEVDDLTDLEDYDELFEVWEESKDMLDGDERMAYLDARYNITESTDFDALDYVVRFPEELLP